MTIDQIRRSPVTQLLSLGVLALLLQIPIVFIWTLVEERARTRADAVREIADGWGREQQIVGPFLVVPYLHRSVEKNSDGSETIRTHRAEAVFLARTLEVDADLKTETRYRGIFETPVYAGTVSLSGRYEIPEFEGWILGVEEVLWEQCRVVVEISDARAIQNPARLQWAQLDIPFEPGSQDGERPGVHAPVAVDPEAESIAFSTTFELHGSSAVRFAPMGADTRVRVAADWPHPSFQGAWLPGERQIDESGFTASWNIPNLGRSFPQHWRQRDEARINESLFGVNLISPVDAYRQTDRSLKYQILFLALTFGTIWLFEVLAGARVHWIQYALIGTAMCLFYLLELSLSEHLGFGAAYAVAAGAVLALVVSYGRAVLRSSGRTATLGAVMAALYGCLYVLLRLEDYALLTGSLLLFAVLAAVMYLTRNVDWGAAGKAPATGPRPSA